MRQVCLHGCLLEHAMPVKISNKMLITMLDFIGKINRRVKLHKA